MYDYIFITNLPSFYKLNLYNEISKKLKIKVIFISSNSNIRNADFFNGEIKFDHQFLTKKNYELRNKLSIFFKLLFILNKNGFKKIVFSGWETIEANLLSFLFKKNNNSIVIESSIKESNLHGLQGFIKKTLINRCSLAFPSGILQKEILDTIGFKGKIHMTHGVGLLNNSFDYRSNKKNFERKFIYVGRLSKEKNIKYLIDAFNINKLSLTIVGAGPEEHYLKSIANSNINFSGYVNNKELYNLLSLHDIFILPSTSEPWGLVIEEALSCGLPVLVSENIGCQFDLVINLDTGLVFPLNDLRKLNDIINKMIDNFNYYHSNALRFNQLDRIKKQVSAYTGEES